MGPFKKIIRKFTKKFDSKVIKRQYFHRKTGLESSESVKLYKNRTLGTEALNN